MKNLTTIGRILFAIPFAIFGINHFYNFAFLAEMYNTFFPIGVYTFFLTGLLLIAVSVSLIVKKYIRLSCFILAAMLLVFIITIHIPQLFFGIPSDACNEKYHVILASTNLLKDISLMGGALMIAGLYPENDKSEK